MIAVIPARGGSKGVPRKNIKLFNQRPLIQWTIERALQSEHLSKVVVSTDDDEISSFSIKSGADVVIRPNELATDTATTIDVLHYHWTAMRCPAELVTLQPTSPLRSHNLIDACISKYLLEENKNKILATGFISKQFEFGSNNNVRRQDLNGYFYDNGSLYIHSSEAISNKIWSSEKAIRYFSKEYENYEIDTEIDFVILEQLHKKFYK